MQLFVYSIILFKEACRFSLYSLLSWRWFCTFQSSVTALYAAYGPWDLPLSLSLSLSLSLFLSLSLSLSLCLSLSLSLSLINLRLIPLFHWPFTPVTGGYSWTGLIASIPRLSRHDRKRQGSFHSFPRAESVYFGVRPWFIGIQSADIVLRWGHRTEQRASQHYFPVRACKWMFGSGLNGRTRTVSAARAMSSIQIYRCITYWAPQAPVHQPVIFRTNDKYTEGLQAWMQLLNFMRLTALF